MTYFQAVAWTKTTGQEEGGNAPTGIRTQVIASRGQYDWPDYTIGARFSVRNEAAITIVLWAGACDEYTHEVTVWLLMVL